MQSSNPTRAEKNPQQQHEDYASSSTPVESGAYDDPFLALSYTTVYNLELVKEILLAQKRPTRK